MWHITGTCDAICGDMDAKHGEVVTEKEQLKERWHKYTEGPHRRATNVNDIFVNTEYEDEPEVFESKVKDAVVHISNKKAPGVMTYRYKGRMRWSK